MSSIEDIDVKSHASNSEYESCGDSVITTLDTSRLSPGKGYDTVSGGKDGEIMSSMSYECQDSDEYSAELHQILILRAIVSHVKGERIYLYNPPLYQLPLRGPRVEERAYARETSVKGKLKVWSRWSSEGEERASKSCGVKGNDDQEGTPQPYSSYCHGRQLDADMSVPYMTSDRVM